MAYPIVNLYETRGGFKPASSLTPAEAARWAPEFEMKDLAALQREALHVACDVLGWDYETVRVSGNVVIGRPRRRHPQPAGAQ